MTSRMSDLFTFTSARSHGVDDYVEGNVPLVTSTMLNNGVVGLVAPQLGDKVFEGPALVISGLGQATVQLTKFLPKGNGGDSLTICVPREPISTPHLVALAAAFNYLHAWRFSFGRKCSVSRISPLQIPDLPRIEPIWDDAASTMTRLAASLSNQTGP